MATPSADDQQRVYAIVRKLYGPAATFQVFPRRVVVSTPEGETGELVPILDIIHPDALYMAEAALQEQIRRGEK